MVGGGWLLLGSGGVGDCRVGETLLAFLSGVVVLQLGEGEPVENWFSSSAL